MSVIRSEALWLGSPRAELEVGPVTPTPPGPGEVLVRAAAVAVNPVDTMTWWQRRLIYPWLRYPAVLGTDVAGEVVQVGPDVEALAVGDRVVGLAAGQEQDLNSAAHGAFQSHVVLAADVTTRLPDTMSAEEAAVLPLGAATAAAGLFQRDQLGLETPGPEPVDRDATVLVWGGSTSVGCNAVQLARHAGYRVVATASPHNHALLRRLGAAHVVDYRTRDGVAQVQDALRGQRLAGILAIGAGSLLRCVRIARAAGRGTQVASVQPGPATAAVGLAARPFGVAVSAVWGGTVTRDEVGRTVFTQVLPRALAAGTYVPAPPAEVVGSGLEAVPTALARLRAGVSARKLVVTLGSHASTGDRDNDDGPA